MPVHGRDSFVSILEVARAVAIIRARDAATARAAMDAAIRGGFRVIEFTLNTPGALDLVADFAQRRDLTVGAGTVLRITDAEAAVRAGARFLVSPVLDDAVVHAANRLGVPLLPGTATPTEMWRAHEAGLAVVKLFPAPAGGPAWIRAIHGPLPFLRIVPTQGVDDTNAAAWIDAGALAVGSGGYLFPPEALEANRWEVVEERARRLLAALGRQAR